VIKRDNFSTAYKDEKAVLSLKKQNAFASKDLKKWEVDQEKLPITKLDLINDKKMAFRYMFTNDSIDLRNLRDHWGYFNSQLFTQSKEFARLKFSRMSHNIAAYVQSVNERINNTMGAYIDLSTRVMMAGMT
jgi:hypothetical protein